MTVLAVVLMCLGCVIIGVAIATRAMEQDHHRLEQRRLQLDLDVLTFRKEQARASAENVRRQHFDRVVRQVLDENPPAQVLPFVGRAGRKGVLS